MFIPPPFSSPRGLAFFDLKPPLAIHVSYLGVEPCLCIANRLCQQIWKMQLAHTKKSKYILEKKIFINHSGEGGEEGGREGDAIIMGGAFEELGNAAFGHLYMTTSFSFLCFLSLSFSFSFCFFPFSALGLALQKKSIQLTGQPSALAASPPRMVDFIQREILLFFSSLQTFFSCLLLFPCLFLFFSSSTPSI